MLSRLPSPDAQPVTETASLDEYFADWESHVFGFGYGTGEDYVLGALRRFMELCPAEDADSRAYDHEELARELSPAVAWLLINVMGHADIIEYGTSPRYAWLTPCGYRLRQFVLAHTLDELIEMIDRGEGCSPTSCNHGPQGYEKGRVCQNPFWLESAAFVSPRTQGGEAP